MNEPAFRTPPLDTPVRNRPVLLAEPDSAHGRALADALGRALERAGASVHRLCNPAAGMLDQAAGPAVIVGNLGDSRCVRDLYGRFWCATDAWYPGPGGFELRTLADPTGSGFNVILAGYSDAAGARALAERAPGLAVEPLPPLWQVRAARLPFDERDAAALRSAPLDVARLRMDEGTTAADWKGYLYYLTGDPALGKAYRRVWDRYLELECFHLCALNKFLPALLLDGSGLFPDALRRRIYAFLWRWADGPQGAAIVRAQQERRRPALPAGNHELVPALALAYVAGFLAARAPGRPEPRAWRELAARSFARYGASWKSHCDGLCHGWFLSQPMLGHFGLLDPAHRFFEEGGARAAAECALAIVNPMGWMPSAGDSDLLRQFPGPTLRMAAAWYGDGRYRFAHDRAPMRRRFSVRQGAPLLRAFDTGLAPAAPADTVGVTVIPVDPAVYRAWSRHAPDQASLITTTGPTAPIGRCFDKLAVRSGWDPESDYLLVDGLSGGGHSPNDAAGVLEYMRLGVSALVAEGSTRLSASDLVITRNGATALPPGFCELLRRESDANGHAHLRLRLADPARTDWIRDLYLRRGAGLVVCDTVTVHEAGDYALESHARMPGAAALHGDRVAREAVSPAAGPVRLSIQRLPPAGLEVRLAARDIPFDAVYRSPEARSAWEERYQTGDRVVTDFVGRVCGSLPAGAVRRMAFLVQVRRAGEPDARLATRRGRLVLEGGGGPVDLCPWPEPGPPGRPAAPSSAARPEPVYTARSPIAAHAVTGAGFRAVGGSGGDLALLDPAGRVRWRRDLEAPLHALAALERGGQVFRVWAGCGPAGLRALDGDGRALWSAELPFRPMNAWWFHGPSPSVVAAAGAWAEDAPALFAGSADGFLHRFDDAGAECWHAYLPSIGVPAHLRLVDIAGDGAVRLLAAGGRQLSFQAHLAVYDLDGTLRARPMVPAANGCPAAALAVGPGGAECLAAVGLVRDANVHLLDLARLDYTGSWPPVTRDRFEPPHHRLFRDGLLWSRRLGGAVSGVALDPARGRVYAATDQGFLAAFDRAGAALWHWLAPGPLGGCAQPAAGLLAAASEDGVWWLSEDGAVLGHGPADRAGLLDARDGALWAVSGARLLRLAAPAAGRPA